MLAPDALVALIDQAQQTVEQALVVLAEATRVHEDARAQQQASHTAWARVQDQRQVALQGGWQGGLLHNHNAYEQTFLDQALQDTQQVTTASARLAHAQNGYQDALKTLRSYQVLAERQRRARQAREDRAEQRLLDDIAQRTPRGDWTTLT